MTVRWGIIGTGGIASAMARALEEYPDAEIVAVASRTRDRADAFASEHGIPVGLGTYEEIATVDGLDCVYVATTHDWHRSTTAACLEAGVPVLCEKPLATSLAEADAILEVAHRTGVFLMEGMWMRCNPGIRRAMALVDAGAIGEVVTVDASFGLARTFDPAHRLVNPMLAGGATLDLGVYPLHLAHLFLGPPTGFEATGRLARGVDVHAEVLGTHRGGFSRSASSLVADLANEAVIGGTEGRIRLHRPHHHPPAISLERGDGGVVETIDVSFEGSGFRFELDEVHRCLTEGHTESRLVPHAATRDVMAWIDGILGRLGVVYPDFGH